MAKLKAYLFISLCLSGCTSGPVATDRVPASADSFATCEEMKDVRERNLCFLVGQDTFAAIGNYVEYRILEKRIEEMKIYDHPKTVGPAPGFNVDLNSESAVGYLSGIVSLGVIGPFLALGLTESVGSSASSASVNTTMFGRLLALTKGDSPEGAVSLVVTYAGTGLIATTAISSNVDEGDTSSKNGTPGESSGAASERTYQSRSVNTRRAYWEAEKNDAANANVQSKADFRKSVSDLAEEFSDRVSDLLALSPTDRLLTKDNLRKRLLARFDRTIAATKRGLPVIRIESRFLLEAIPPSGDLSDRLGVLHEIFGRPTGAEVREIPREFRVRERDSLSAMQLNTRQMGNDLRELYEKYKDAQDSDGRKIAKDCLRQAKQMDDFEKLLEAHRAFL